MEQKMSCREYVFENPRLAPLWLIVRIYVGWMWLEAGWAKVTNPLWFGADAGGPLTGFINGALSKTGGAHPDVYAWYAKFLETLVLPYPHFWSHLVAGGEFLVGIGLILGFFTGITAFFGAFMNLNYLFAGTVSVNPLFYTLGILLMLSWKVSGNIGLDRYLLPCIEKYCKEHRRT